MNALYLLSFDGSIRPCKATSDQVADVLEGRETSDRLATIALEDGGIVATPLGVSQLDALRSGLQLRRAGELCTVLNHKLTALRLVEKMRGFGCYSSQLVVDLEEAPWAEDVIREWAEREGLTVHDEPMPTVSTKRWRRTADVKAYDKSWGTTIVAMCWPPVAVDGASIVARDAELDGRVDDAAAIRAEAEMPF